MKKFSLLIGLLVIVFAATAYAQPVEFKMSGFIDSTFLWLRNIPSSSGTYAAGAGTEIDPNAGQPDRYGALANSRARLKFQANAGKELSGTIFFEMDSATWGDANGTRNAMGYWNADRAAVEVKHAFFDVAVPYFGVPVPMQLRFGVQPFAIRDSLFLYVDGAGITATMKPDPVNIKFMWGKPWEGSVFNSDDGDMYAVDVSGAMGDFTLGAHGSYFNLNAYPVGSSGERADLYWLGLYADGKYAGFNFSGDFIYSGGKVKEHTGLAADPYDVKYRGWIAALKASYPWENWEFGGGAFYATGANVEDDDKVKAYVQPPGSEPGPDSWAGYSLVFYGSGLIRGEYAYAANTSHGEAIGNAIGGTWAGFLYAGLKVTPWYKAYLQAMYIGDTTKNGNTVGTAIKNGELRDDKTIGFELTLTNIFKVYNNLDLYVIGGYLFAGDALDMYDAAKGKNVSLDDPFQVATRLVYSF